jgi:hypothetical protein
MTGHVITLEGAGRGGTLRGLPGQGRRVPIPAQGGNGQIVAVGESYPSKDGARAGVEAVKRAAAEATTVEV